MGRACFGKAVVVEEMAVGGNGRRLMAEKNMMSLMRVSVIDSINGWL